MNIYFLKTRFFCFVIFAIDAIIADAIQRVIIKKYIIF